MRAVLIGEPGTVSVASVPDPIPGPGEVVVAVAACGICGTDLHIVDGEFAPTRYPIVPGHEFAGQVVALGDGVTDVGEGAMVAVDPSLFCGGIEVAHAALIEPLSCAVHGFDLLPRRLGEHYLIYGAGTMGLLMLQLARQAGAASLSVVDLNANRLAIATKLGADAVATSASELDRPQGWEVVIDCTGVVAAIEDALTHVRRGGTFQQFGVAPADAMASFSPFRVYHDEITIVGSMAVLASFGRAVELMGRGVVDADTIISHSFALDDYPDALSAFRTGWGLKLQVRPGIPARQ